MTRVRVLAVLAVAALLSLLTPSEAQEKRGTLIFGRGSDSITLDPAVAQDGESVAVIDNVFDGLVRYSDEGTEIEPALATRWEHSPDGKTWTFHLRENVKFHDGSPFDAEAVVFTFQRLIDTKHPCFNPEFANRSLYPIVRVSAKDPRTVVFELERPVAAFLGNLTVYTARIVCPGPYRKDPRGYAERPVGTGAFVFKSWERSQKIILEANKDHFFGRPAVDRVILVPIKENASRLEQLKAGKLHVMDGVSPTTAREIEGRKELVLVRQTGMNVGYLAFNTERGPFKDARLRRAAALALDPGRIVATNYQGMGTVAKNLMPPFILGWDASAPEPRTRKDEAKAELAKISALVPPIKVELLHMAGPRPYMPEPKQTALVIQDDLRQVGIECTLATMDWNLYVPKVDKGEFEAALFGWTGDTSDPDNFLYVLCGRDNIGTTNVSRYADEEYNKTCLEAQSELDTEKRKALYVRAQKKLRDDVPLVPIVHSDALAAHRTNVKGFKLHPTGRREFRQVSVEK